MKKIPLQSAGRHRMGAFAHSKVSYDDELQSGRDPDEDDEHADVILM